MTPKELADQMRQEVKGQCLDCGQVHDQWHAGEKLGWGLCDNCHSTVRRAYLASLS